MLCDQSVGVNIRIGVEELTDSVSLPVQKLRFPLQQGSQLHHLVQQCTGAVVAAHGNVGQRGRILSLQQPDV